MSEITENERVRVGIEICTIGLRAASVLPNGRVGLTKTIETTGPAETYDRLGDLITDLKETVGTVEKIGIAVPGLVNREEGKIEYSALMPEQAKFDLVQIVADATGVSATLENDANAAAWGEYKLGAGRGSDDLFYATLGEGVGGAFILGGKLWHGASGFAGEFGYVPINSEGMKLEEVASAANIIRRTKSRFHTDSTSSLNNLREESIRLDDIISAARERDDFAQMMLGRTGVYVGTAIASVINLLNVGKIIVGGDIMEAKDLVLNAIVSRARELSFRPAFQATKIVAGELGAYAAAAGAALIPDEIS
jgi:glucokinase